MHCFRERGYGATSIRDLEKLTGLKAASLYKAFGNKASLFCIALDRYTEEVIARRIATHLVADNGLDGIRSFFSSTYRTEPKPTQGCLLTNTAIEAPVVDGNAHKRVERGLIEIREAFEAQIESCQDSGEIGLPVDAASTAQVLIVLYEGLLVLLRSGASVVTFDRVIDTAIDSLFAPATLKKER